MLRRFVPVLFPWICIAQTPNWPTVNEEVLRHYTSVVRMDTTDPPGNETRVVEYG